MPILFFVARAFAVTAPMPFRLKAAEILIPVGHTGRSFNLLELSTISLKDFQQLAGKRLKFPEKTALKLAQKKLRSSINEDGTIIAQFSKKLIKKAFLMSMTLTWVALL